MPSDARVEFEETQDQLTAVQIVRSGRAPLITKLHAALLTLGIVVSTYRVRAHSEEVTERLVLESQDGGSIDDQLRSVTKSTILELARDFSPDSSPRPE